MYSVAIFDTVDENAGLLCHLFCEREKTLPDCLKKMRETELFAAILDSAVQRIFDERDWLDLYEDEADFLSSKHKDPERQQEAFLGLAERYGALNPPHGEPLEKIIRYIQYHPEDDLRQKVLAEKLNISASYFSMMFAAQTGLRYVDYISCVKLMRSAWLLRNSNMKIHEIAARMYYKDTTYFSRQFKKIFHLTPSEYRIPDAYKFEI